jgi:single-stranded-DNA-specific exonuclease
MGIKEKKWKKLLGFSGKREKSKYPDWLLNVLANRGLNTEQQISSYLSPKYEDLLSPDSFMGIAEAVEKIAVARDKKEKITVYGDYDVDGITATALIVDVLNKIGVQKVETYIPHREEEGYGLNSDAIDEIAKGKTSLLITVDCGITSSDLIEQAKSQGMDVIVCDHHEIEKNNLPKTTVVHPQLVNKGVEKQQLCACGMAFYLARGIQERFIDIYPTGQEKWLLDLVALGTICDVVPLIGQNRILAKFGLSVIAKSKRIGIYELIKSAKIAEGDINAYAVGFLLGPRINAAGRLTHAKKALELLTTEDRDRASKIAEELGKLNSERQKLCERILEEAKAEIETSDKKDHEIFLLSNTNWPRGVVGIIASKLSDAYARPVIVFEDDGVAHHGSARSIEGFDITEALGECRDHLLKFGGHAKAAGLTVSAAKFVIFSDKLLSIAKKKIKTADLAPLVVIDTEIKEEEISDKVVETITAMEPFGYGNSTPTFLMSNIAIENVKKVGGAGEHIKFNLTASGLSAIFFNNQVDVSEKMKYDLVFGLRYNFWNQRKSIEVRIIDMKEA